MIFLNKNFLRHIKKILSIKKKTLISFYTVRLLRFLLQNFYTNNSNRNNLSYFALSLNCFFFFLLLLNNTSIQKKKKNSINLCTVRKKCYFDHDISIFKIRESTPVATVLFSQLVGITDV